MQIQLRGLGWVGLARARGGLQEQEFSPQSNSERTRTGATGKELFGLKVCEGNSVALLRSWNNSLATGMEGCPGP